MCQCTMLVFAIVATIGSPSSEAAHDQISTLRRSFIAYGASAETQEVVAVRFQYVDGGLVSEIVQRESVGFEAAPVIFHEGHRLLYCASLRSQKSDGNKLTVFTVRPDGGLSRKETTKLIHGSAYLSFDRSGRFLLSASYFDGDVDIYRLNAEGIPDSRAHSIHEGRDKAHSIYTTNDNRFAYVPYVKDRNALFQYKFDKTNGRLLALNPPEAKVPENVGPRHVAYHPTKPFVFFSNEQHLGATVYRIGALGQLKLHQVCQPGALKPATGLAASDIVITPTGQFLFVGVRDFENSRLNAIHRYEVRNDGTLMHLGKTDADAIPWGLELSPDGQCLLVTAAHGETLNAYEIGARGDLIKRSSIKWGKMIRDIAVVVVE